MYVLFYFEVNGNKVTNHPDRNGRPPPPPHGVALPRPGINIY